MKGKHLLILTLIAAVLIGLTLLSSRKQSKPSRSVVGAKVFPALAVNDIQTLDIKAAAETTTVARIDGIWRVANRHNYPADFGKIRDFLTKLADLKALQSVRATEQQRRELHLLSGTGIGATEQPTLVDLLDASGKSIETLLLGKERLRPSSSPEPGPYGNFPDGRFVGAAGNIFLVGDPLTEAVATPRSWMDEELFSVNPEDIASIEISGITNGIVMLTRTNGATAFTLPHVPDGKEADSAALTRLSSALNYLRFEDIADPATPDASLGLDKPVTYVARTFKGETYTASIGHSAAPDSKIYARFSITFTPPPVPAGADATNQVAKAQAEQNGKLAADTKRLAAKLAPWTYVLNTYTAESFTMGFTDLLKDKPKPEEK